MPLFLAGLLLMPLLLALTAAGGVLVAGVLTGAGSPAALWIGVPLLSLAVLGRPLAVWLLSRRRWCQAGGAAREESGADLGAAFPMAREGGRRNQPGIPSETLQVEGATGGRLHVERTGQPGQPMLLLTPGLGQSTAVWDDVWPLVYDGCQVVTWDLPGLGRSAPRPDGDYSLAALARDLRCVLESQADRVGPGGVALVGQSLSAMLILEFCRLSLAEPRGAEGFDRRIAALVLVDGTDSPPLTTMAYGELWQRLRQPLIEPGLRALIALGPLLNPLLRLCYYNGSFVVPVRAVAFAGRQPPAALDRLARILSHNPVQSTAQIALGSLDFDAASLLPRIGVPVLLIHGAQDYICTRTTAERMARRLPCARMEVWEPARHVSCLEYPERFRRLLRGDLAGVGADGEVCAG
jgi:pimeloyl-ACP methyl ester carboxylesterase